MNIGITTSFLVGGLLLLSILHMNFTVTNNSTQTTLQLMAKNRMMAVTETMTADFGRMGYNVPDDEEVITSSIVDSKRIEFKADLDDDGSETPETITWDFDSDASTLIRTGPVSSGSGNVETEYPVAEFKFSYYDVDGEETTDPTQVRRIKVQVVCESPEPITTNGNNEVYGRSIWQKTIAPPSLQFRQN